MELNTSAGKISTVPSAQFFALPTYVLAQKKDLNAEERLTPELPDLVEVVEKALAGTEYRHFRARDHVRALLSSDAPKTVTAASHGLGPAALFAQSPQDLPALLRLADQLDNLAQRESGERALVWKCHSCGTRYAVPVALVRSVSIRCERCGEAVELAPGLSVGEEALVDPHQSAVNVARKQLAAFFRDAMARGWQVFVAEQSSTAD